MKRNYSARKLLAMAMTGQHMPNCQRTAFPVVDCLCLQHEVKAYEDRLASKRSTRVHKPKAKKPTKVHLDFAAHGISKKIGCKNKQNVASDLSLVTCQHCLKAGKKMNLNPLNPVAIPNSGTGVNYAGIFINP